MMLALVYFLFNFISQLTKINVTISFWPDLYVLRQFESDDKKLDIAIDHAQKLWA